MFTVVILLLEKKSYPMSPELSNWMEKALKMYVEPLPVYKPTLKV